MRQAGSLGGYACADAQPRTEPRMREHHDTIVIGGGQAGLAMSAVLQRRGREHIVLERGRVGERWRTERWDSLRFQFPNWSIQLPGYAYSGDDPDGFAHYREHPAASSRTTRRAAGRRCASTPRSSASRRTPTARDSCSPCRTARSTPGRSSLATGPFQRPCIPQWRRTSRRRCCRPTRRAIEARGAPGRRRARRRQRSVGCQIARRTAACRAPVFLSVAATGAPRAGSAARMSTGG